MNDAFKHALRLLILRSGPQDMPYSPALLAILLLCSIVLAHLQAAAVGEGQAAARAMLGIAFGFSYLYLLLSARGHAGRIVQAYCASLIAGLLLGLMALPLNMLLGQAEVAAVPPHPDIVIALLLLVFWSVLVDAHILRHALEVRLIHGFGLSIAGLILYLTVYSMVFAK